MEKLERQAGQPRLGAALSLSLLLGCLGWGLAAGQDNDAKKDSPPVKVTTGSETLIIALRAKAGEDEKNIAGTFRAVKQRNRPKGAAVPLFDWKGEAKLQKIKKETYLALESFIEGGTLFDEDADDGRPRLSKGKAEFWNIDLGDTDDVFLHSITLKYKAAEKEGAEEVKSATYVLNTPKDGVELRRRGGNRYTLKGKLKFEPISYVLIKTNDKDPKQPGESMAEQPWPKVEEVFYLVKLEGWSGDQVTMFKALSSKKVMVTPVTVSTKFSTVGVGSFLFAGRKVRGGFKDATQFVFRISMPPEASEPEDEVRAWMLFPLTRQQAEEAAKELGKWAFDQVVPEHIAKQDRVLVRDDQGKPLPFALKPKEKARWIEVPLGSLGAFERTVTVEDIQGWWKEEEAAKGADSRRYRLIVWEVVKKDGENLNHAVLIDDDKAKRKVTYLIEEVTEWPNGLRTQAAMVKQKDRTKKKDDE